MDNEFVFIGSRLGDPQLIKLFVSEKTADNNAVVSNLNFFILLNFFLLISFLSLIVS